MMHAIFRLSGLWTLLPFFTIATALPHVTRNVEPSTVHTITQFPNGTWIENLAIRSNGQALVTLLNVPELHLIDPDHGGQSKLVHRFSDVTGATGITEVEDDVFAVIVGNFSLTSLQGTQGSYSIWKVDMRSFEPEHNTPANITKIVDIPQTSLLNGMTSLDSNGVVLIADSVAGVVWRVDTRSGDAKVVIDDLLMKPPAGTAIGINGLDIFKGALYFTNSFASTFNRVSINSDGTPSGAAQTIAACSPVCDDFTIDGEGNAFVAQNPANMIRKITPGGVETVVVGGLNSTELVGPTSVRFSRKGGEGSVLYGTTSGGLAGPVNGTFVEGGKVVSINLHD